MKLSKAQQALMKRVENGESIRRKGYLFTWFSMNMNGDPVNAATVRILMDAGLISQREYKPGYFELRAPIDYSADDDGDFDTWTRITPDAAGETGAPEPTPRPVNELRVAWNTAHIMARLYGTYSEKAQRMSAVFASMFAVRNVRYA